VDPREADGISETRDTQHHTHGTKLVWNSFRSTLRDPSKRREAVMEDTTCAMSLLRLVKEGDDMPRFRRQMS